MTEQIKRTVEAIKEDILALFQLILEDDSVGMNTKIQKNTLADSKLHDDAKVEVTDNFTFNLFHNFYLEYIERGRKPEETKVPVGELLKWADRKGLSTDNKFIFAVRNSIWKKGIPARQILKPFSDEMDKCWDDWSQELFMAITAELDNYFKS